MQENRKNPVGIGGLLRSPASRAGLTVIITVAALGAFAWGMRWGLEAGSGATPPLKAPQPAAVPASPATEPARASTAATPAPVVQAAQPPAKPAATQARQRPASTAAESAAKPAAQASQQMVWPYQGGILRGFGWAYSGTYGDWRFHQGFDISASEGDEVVAAMGGKVVSIEESEMYGVRITLEHSARLKTVYSNLGSALVRKGDSVKAGDAIATVGRAAFEWVDPIHLHFETVGESGPVDPAKHLK